MDNATIKLPLLPIRDPELVVFPELYCEIDVGRTFSVNAIKKAVKDKSRLIIGIQKNYTVNFPKAKDFYGHCTEAEIKSELFLDKDGTKLRIIIVGIRRAILKTVGNTEKYIYGNIEPIIEPEVKIDEKVQNLFKEMRDMIREHAQFISVENDNMPSNSYELSKFIDIVAGQLPISGKKRIKILSIFDPKYRMELVSRELAKVINNVETEIKTTENDNTKEDSSESLSGMDSEINKLKQRINESGMPPDVMKIATNEFRKLSMISPGNSEFQVTHNYLEHLVSLPWNKSTEDKIDIEEARKILDEDHYGLKKPKERVLEFLAVKKLNPNRKGSILCFSGPPGTGKAQPLNSRVLTPNGFVKMGNISVGDKVTAPDGQESNVIGVFPQGIKDVYKIKLSDGSSTRSCKEHLWKIQTEDDIKNNKFRIIDTESLMINLEHGKKCSIKPVDYDINFNNRINIDPYLVGILLSEFKTENSFNRIEEIIRILLKYDCEIIRHGSNYNISVINRVKEKSKSTIVDFIKNSELGEAFHFKSIPHNYKYCSSYSRVKLLCGILDGSKTLINNSYIEWSSFSYKFASDMVELVQSFGGQAVYNCDKENHKLFITLPKEVMTFCSGTCSNKELSTYNGSENLHRYIDNIEFDGREETQCILIDHPDHLYITDNFIVTHNTSLGKSIAKATGREFVRMSLGGVGDEAEIRGHRRTYVGAIPGRIMENIKKVGSKNPVFMLDEIDKLCANLRGDPSAALLEVLDPEQNNSFIDHYLSVPFDLSQVLFIGTVNEIGPIAPALRDRLEIIEVPGYSPFDKVKIAQGYLVPKQKKENGLKGKDIVITSNAINKIIDEYTSEAGVRSLERECGTLMRKLAVMLASGKEPPKSVKVDMITKCLGPPKTFIDKAVDKPEVGLSTGLAWSKYGGSILFVETSLTPGEGKVKLTGNLGKVIQESVTAAYTWICSNAVNLNVSEETLKKYDVHIHFPAGAVPKDGPSAGIAIAASMLSVFTNRPVDNNIAMTGEITLRGRVLPIGGLKEKILAAHRAGIKHVIFPIKNKYDLDEIPQDVVSNMKFSKVRSLKEALDLLLLNGENNTSNDINTGSGEQLMNKEMF